MENLIIIDFGGEKQYPEYPNISIDFSNLPHFIKNPKIVYEASGIKLKFSDSRNWNEYNIILYASYTLKPNTNPFFKDCIFKLKTELESIINSELISTYKVRKKTTKSGQVNAFVTDETPSYYICGDQAYSKELYDKIEFDEKRLSLCPEAIMNTSNPARVTYKYKGTTWTKEDIKIFIDFVNNITILIKTLNNITD